MPISDTGSRPWGDWYTQISVGRVEGARNLRIQGLRNNIGQVPAGVDIYGGSFDKQPIPDPSGVILKVKSSSLNDTLLGSGANTAQIVYINTLGEEVITNVNLAGVTEANPIITDCRYVNDFYITKSGNTADLNTALADGDIILYLSGSESTVYNIIKRYKGRSFNSSRMVPSGKQYLIDDFIAYIDGNKVGDVELQSNCTDFGVITSNFITKAIIRYRADDKPISYKSPVSIPSGAVIKVSASFLDASLTDISTNVVGIQLNST